MVFIILIRHPELKAKDPEVYALFVLQRDSSPSARLRVRMTEGSPFFVYELVDFYRNDKIKK